MNSFCQNITNEEVNSLPRAAFGGQVIVVDSEEMVDEACDWLLQQRIIGFDTETRPSFKAGVTNKVALLQLSGEDRCYLFRLCRMRLDKAIIKVLASPDVIKIGAAVRDDIKGLQALRHFQPKGFVDLQNIVCDWGINEKAVRKVAAITLDVAISKAQRLSNWEATKLTDAQMSYAATDAWVCLEMYNKLMDTPKQQSK